MLNYSVFTAESATKPQNCRICGRAARQRHRLFHFLSPFFRSLVMSLRIIGGEFRRRLLKTPPTKATRPYTDRVRQVVFDRIGDIVPDARVADVFSGVGTMGLEALSRGAQSCVFIEGDPKVHAALKENVAALADDLPTVCWKTNIHRTSFRPQGAELCLPYSLVFFDPPYAQCPLLAKDEPLGKCLVRLAKPDVTAPDALMLLRTPEHFEFSESDAWHIRERWRISTMNLWLLERSDQTPQPGEDSQHPSPSESKE